MRNVKELEEFVARMDLRLRLGRALGHFIFSLIGLKRILFTNIFQRLLKLHLGGELGLLGALDEG